MVAPLVRLQVDINDRKQRASLGLGTKNWRLLRKCTQMRTDVHAETHVRAVSRETEHTIGRSESILRCHLACLKEFYKDLQVLQVGETYPQLDQYNSEIILFGKSKIA